VRLPGRTGPNPSSGRCNCPVNRPAMTDQAGAAESLIGVSVSVSYRYYRYRVPPSHHSDESAVRIGYHLVSFRYVIRCGRMAASPRVCLRHLSYSEMVPSTNVALVPPSIANVLGARLLDQPVLGVDVRDHRASPSVAATSLTILNARSRSNAAKSAGRNTGRRFASSCCRSVASRAGETSTGVFPGTTSFARTSERSR